MEKNSAESALIESLAGRIVSLGFDVPAVFFLEANIPVSRLAGAGLIILEPILSLIFGTKIKAVAALVNNPGNIELLVERVGALSEQRGRKKI